MKVVVIDPYERTVTEREIAANVHAFQEIVRGTFETLRFSDTACYVNANGTYLKDRASFVYRDPRHGMTVPIIGRAFLCTARPGQKLETDCTLSLETVQERVEWAPAERAKPVQPKDHRAAVFADLNTLSGPGRRR